MAVLISNRSMVSTLRATEDTDTTPRAARNVDSSLATAPVAAMPMDSTRGATGAIGSTALASSLTDEVGWSTQDEENPFQDDPDQDGYYPPGDTAYEFRYPKPDGGYDGSLRYYSTPPEPGFGASDPLQACVRMRHDVRDLDGIARVEWRPIPDYLDAPLPLSDQIRREAISALKAQAANGLSSAMPSLPPPPPRSPHPSDPQPSQTMSNPDENWNAPSGTTPTTGYLGPGHGTGEEAKDNAGQEAKGARKGRCSNEELEEYRQIASQMNTIVRNAAVKWGREPAEVMLKVGMVVKMGRAPNSKNRFSNWYAKVYPRDVNREFPSQIVCIGFQLHAEKGREYRQEIDASYRMLRSAGIPSQDILKALEPYFDEVKNRAEYADAAERSIQSRMRTIGKRLIDLVSRLKQLLVASLIDGCCCSLQASTVFTVSMLSA
jgi:hypothetical protein